MNIRVMTSYREFPRARISLSSSFPKVSETICLPPLIEGDSIVEMFCGYLVGIGYSFQPKKNIGSALYVILGYSLRRGFYPNTHKP